MSSLTNPGLVKASVEHGGAACTRPPPAAGSPGGIDHRSISLVEEDAEWLEVEPEGLVPRASRFSSDSSDGHSACISALLQTSVAELVLAMGALDLTQRR